MSILENVQTLDRIAELTGLIASTEYLVSSREYWDLAVAGIGQDRADQVKAQHVELLADFKRLLADQVELYRNPPPSLKKQLASMLLASMNQKDLEDRRD